MISEIRYRLLFVLFLMSLGAGLEKEVGAQGNLVPPPKTDAEAREMMKATYELRVLPPGAQPELVQSLLEVGELIIYYDHLPLLPWMACAGILINAPPELVFAVLNDYEHYPDFVPFTEKMEFYKMRNNFSRTDLHLNLKMSFLHYRLDYGVYNYDRPPYRRDWAHAWGEFGVNVGFSELIPSSEGKRTMFFYSVYSEPRSKFLKMIYAREPSVEMMTSLSTATMFVWAIKSEAEKRAKAQGIKLEFLKTHKPIREVLSQDPVSMKKMLEQGNLVILEKGPTVYAVAGGLVNAEMGKAYQVITDFSHYPEFIPGVKKVEFLGKEENGARYKYWLDFNLSVLHYRQTPEWLYQFSPPEFVSWQIPRPCCGDAPGFWKLISLEGKSLIFYGNTADIRSLGRIPRYALSVEPTLEYATLASQGILVINALKARIQR